MKIYLNLATVGAKVTGLGVYALACARAVCRHYDTVVIHNETYNAPVPASIASPPDVALGAGLIGALKRVFFLRNVKIPLLALSYSPTHHCAGKAKFSIITIHDLIALRHPNQHFAQWLYFRFILPKIAKKSTAIFTVSETSKLDIADAYNVPKHRIFVVPNQIDTEVFRPNNGTKEPFLLCVGGKFFHKNIHELLKNNQVWSSLYSLKIVSSSGKYRKYLQSLVNEIGLQDKVEFHGFISHDELVSEYQKCSAFIYPSKWEGFGIPPLEALACGAPVIVSDIPVHREVCSDAAIYVSLGDPTSWKQAFAALGDPALTAQLQLSAQDRIREFSQAQFERKLITAFESVASEHKFVLQKKRAGEKELNV